MGNARRNPAPIGATAVMVTSAAATPSGTPQPPSAPPWEAMLPAPAIWNGRRSSGLTAPSTYEVLRVSTARHGAVRGT